MTYDRTSPLVFFSAYTHQNCDEHHVTSAETADVELSSSVEYHSLLPLSLKRRSLRDNK